jgi:CRISPR-associated endonuclease/helicase Cas3
VCEGGGSEEPEHRGRGRIDYLFEGCWAKLAPREQPVRCHPLIDHCHDVAASFEALIALPMFERRLARLAGRDAVPDDWPARLVVLAFLHDFGKVNHKFQSGKGGHIDEAVFPVLNAGTCQATGLDRLEGWSAKLEPMLQTVLAYHGWVPNLPGDGAQNLRGYRTANTQRDPVAEVARLVDEAIRCWPQAFDPAGPRCPTLRPSGMPFSAFCNSPIGSARTTAPTRSPMPTQAIRS